MECIVKVEMNYYEEKQARKLERAKELLVKHEAEKEAAFKRAHDIGDAIPFGQPILVGHHSEKHHRRDLERIDNAMRKGMKEIEIVDHYANRISNLENPHAISSDDPEAVQKLKDKLVCMEKEREEIKSRPHQGWELSNLSGNMRRVKERIKELEAKAAIPELNEVINGVKLVVDKEENRVKLIFPAKPSPEIIAKLKQNGFHWSPFNKAWQRMVNSWSIQLAKDIVSEVKASV